MPDVLNRTYKSDHEKKYSILYVDDEVVNLRIFERTFKKYYEVYTAPSGKDAMKIMSENRLDLIMTDYQMPNMTGVELLLKVVPKFPNIVRMIMTGFSDEKAIMEVDDKVGLDRLLVKPWNKDDLKGEFDRALDMRYGQVNGKNSEAVDEVPDDDPLDLVESTLSLVELGDNQELRDDINSLVEANKSKKRPEFMKGDNNDLLCLKESLLPFQQEIKLYVDDSIIIYDHRSVNKNGYWFGEIDDHLIIVSFSANTTAIRALTLNTFIGAMLTEMVYKERNKSADKLIADLSARITARFIEPEKDQKKTIDIAVMVINRETELIEAAGANHDLYYYDESGEFKVLKGIKDPLTPGKKIKLVVQKMETFDAKELYLIPKSVIEEVKEDGAEELGTLKQLLDEIHKYPMNMQSKLFDEYHYKSVIGLRF